ncbi:geranylgeranyl reductase family protein [Granulicella sp. 5B5]|uniref:geranylgeranyl reductase family protein n=1 Tax=Granulicella sp. 5B5 TaxID=1617967 RepID=UPI0015F67199|nr:geranylgeranyl reductase family protein [Granulicella sp. 5B5]QMV18523.1 geranylgeranyl reductase family protein [Granulicella sp. 5B5]
MLSYDVLIAGAGPAGCAAAYDLAQGGRRVLLLDRRIFPRHKACACGLTRKTLTALRYSVEPVTERVCHEIVLQQATDDASRREVRVRTPNLICAMAVRERFDAFCLQQTLAAGRNGGSVVLLKIEGIAAIREGGDGVELDVETAAGPQTFTTPVLIGADGSNGQTRRLLYQQHEPAWYARGFALEACVPYSVLTEPLPDGDAPTDLVFDFAPLPGGYGWLFPKGDHINIGVGVFAPSAESVDISLKSVTRLLLADYTLRKLGVDLGAIGAHVTGQYLGMGGDSYVPRGRVLLVGDAAGLVDPLTGEGIHSAIVSGQAAAAAVLSNAKDIASAYARQLRPLQRTLAFSARAARSFYRDPERGFRAMRHPLLRRIILKTYADGLPPTKLVAALIEQFV